MTKKDYLLIADVMANTRPEYEGDRYEQWDLIRCYISDALEEDNEVFDRVKFRNACMKG